MKRRKPGRKKTLRLVAVSHDELGQATGGNPSVPQTFDQQTDDWIRWGGATHAPWR